MKIVKKQSDVFIGKNEHNFHSNVKKFDFFKMYIQVGNNLTNLTQIIAPHTERTLY